MWAVTVCFLMVCLLWNCAITSLMPGSVFSRDLGSIYVVSFLWIRAGIFLFLQNPWQKWAGIVHLEYVYLTLLFLLGVHLLCYTVDLISLYVCLELQSFSIVVLCSMNYTTPYAIEAGMKYFLLRAFSSRLLLLGIGLIYAQTAHTDLSSIQELLIALYNNNLDL
jgi:NADH-quinone oxidoreductase subunit N